MPTPIALPDSYRAGISVEAPLTVTIREACRLTGLSRRTIYRQQRLGGLTFVKVGNRTLVTYRSLCSLLRPL